MIFGNEIIFTFQHGHQLKIQSENTYKTTEIFDFNFIPDLHENRL